MKISESLALGKAMMQGFRDGIERAENATAEEKQKYYEELSRDRDCYEMMMGHLLFVGCKADEIMSFEEWGESIRNLDANIKRVVGMTKQALKELGVSG